MPLNLVPEDLCFLAPWAKAHLLTHPTTDRQDMPPPVLLTATRRGTHASACAPINGAELLLAGRGLIPAQLQHSA